MVVLVLGYALEKSIYYDFMRFGNSSTVRNHLRQEIAFIRAYLDTIQKTLAGMIGQVKLY